MQVTIAASYLYRKVIIFINNIIIKYQSILSKLII